MFGSYTVTNSKTGDYQTWMGQWTNQGDDWGVTNATRILSSTETPVTPTE